MIKVIQWATGNVGTHALRAILERPDLELVGLKVYDEAKAGRDAGSFVGLPDTGVIAATDVEEILALDADCVNYNALGTTAGDPLGEPLDEICRILAAGFDVTSTAIDFLVHPPVLPDHARERIDTACAEGGTSLFGTGVNPGFTMDLVPVTFSRVCRTIERMHMVESLSMATYDAPDIMAFMGFGKAPEDAKNLDLMHADPEKSVWTASMRQVADAIGFSIDAIRYERAVGVAERSFDIAIGTIEPGQVAVQKISFVGLVDGRDVLVNEFVWRVADDVRPEWGVGDRWTLDITGDPALSISCEASTTSGSGRPTSLTVAMAGVNAIPTVCAAPPGIHSPLTLPVWGGGLLTDPARES